MILKQCSIPLITILLFSSSHLFSQTFSILGGNGYNDKKENNHIFATNKDRPVQTFEKKMIEIRGIYGSPEDFWQKGFNLAKLGVNAIFVRSKSLNGEMIQRAREEGLQIFAEFATLNGSRYVEKHPEAWPINERGKKVEPASWFMGVCPSEPGFKNYKLAELRELLQKFDLDGIWMDYLHWHAQFEEPEPILPETCFCINCLNTFQTETGVRLPEGNTSETATWILEYQEEKWRDWRCSVVAKWVKDFKSVIQSVKPNALLGIYHCPWEDDEFAGARRRYLGLDYDLLKDNVDVFSPIVYHARMGRSVEWVKENIAWLCQRLDIKVDTFPKIWPIVQSYNDPYVISAAEFETVLRYGASSQATGVMMFTSVSTATDQSKTERMKQIYREWMGEDQ